MGANSIIQVRRGLQSEWSGVNPTLLGGEIGYETDTKRGKIGDGSSSYLSLPYVIGTGALSEGGGQGTVTDAFKYIKASGSPGLTITASGSGDTLGFSGISPLSVSINNETRTLVFNVSALGTDDVVGFTGAVERIIDTELLGGIGIALSYNAIDDALTINTSGVPLFETDGDLILENNLTVQGDTTIQGSLTVQGSSITANSTDVNIGDNLITVNVTDAVASGGLRIYRSGTTPSGYATFLWNENLDRFIFNAGSGDSVVQADTFIGNLSGVVSGTVVGNVSGTATNAQNVVVTNKDPNDATTAVLLSTTVDTGNIPVVIDAANLTYNAITNTLSTTTFDGDLAGTADIASTTEFSLVNTNHKFNIVLASGTGSPGSLYLDNAAPGGLSFNPNTDTLFTTKISGVVITGSPTLSLGLPNASYKIQHFNINNCRIDGGTP